MHGPAGVGWVTMFLLPAASLMDGGLLGGLLLFAGTAPLYGLTPLHPAIQGSLVAVIGVSALVLAATMAAQWLAGRSGALAASNG